MKSLDILDLSINKLGVNLIMEALENIENLPRKKQPKNPPTFKARNIKEDEHKTIINWEDCGIKKAWHLSRGIELWLNALEQPNYI